MSDAETVAKQAIQAINDHDLEAYTALHVDDLELLDTATGETFRGREGARANIEAWLTPFPDVQIELVNMIASSEWVAIEAIGRGTHSGPLAGPGGEVEATGRSVEMSFCSTVQVREGKIVAGRDYYNIATMMQQLDLMPEAAVASS